MNIVEFLLTTRGTLVAFVLALFLFSLAFGIFFLSVSFAQIFLPGFFTILSAITCFQCLFFGSSAISGADVFTLLIFTPIARMHVIGILTPLGWSSVQRAAVLSGAASLRAVSLHGAKSS